MAHHYTEYMDVSIIYSMSWLCACCYSTLFNIYHAYTSIIFYYINRLVTSTKLKSLFPMWFQTMKQLSEGFFLNVDALFLTFGTRKCLKVRMGLLILEKQLTINLHCQILLRKLRALLSIQTRQFSLLINIV
jgi:hypothetical protein